MLRRDDILPPYDPNDFDPNRHKKEGTHLVVFITFSVICIVGFLIKVFTNV